MLKKYLLTRLPIFAFLFPKEEAAIKEFRAPLPRALPEGYQFPDAPFYFEILNSFDAGIIGSADNMAIRMTPRDKMKTLRTMLDAFGIPYQAQLRTYQSTDNRAELREHVTLDKRDRLVQSLIGFLLFRTAEENEGRLELPAHIGPNNYRHLSYVYQLIRGSDIPTDCIAVRTVNQQYFHLTLPLDDLRVHAWRQSFTEEYVMQKGLPAFPFDAHGWQKAKLELAKEAGATEGLSPIQQQQRERKSEVA